MKAADKSKRAANFFIDNVLIYILYFILVTLSGIIEDSWSYSKFWSLWYLLIALSYYVFFETKFQKTPGKRLTKTKVVTLEGLKPGFGKILIRTLIRYNPFDVMSYIFGIGKGQHDHFSKTMVVEE